MLPPVFVFMLLPHEPPNLDHSMPLLPTFCFKVAEAMGFPQMHRISILALTKAGCVTLAKFLNFSELGFLLCKMGIIKFTPFQGCCEN